jgi:hypothetical protein
MKMSCRAAAVCRGAGRRGRRGMVRDSGHAYFNRARGATRQEDNQKRPRVWKVVHEEGMYRRRQLWDKNHAQASVPQAQRRSGNKEGKKGGRVVSK